MSVEEIAGLITEKFGTSAVINIDKEATPPALEVVPAKIVEICQELHQNEQTYFDSLACISSVDNGPEAGTLEVVYNLYSIPYDLRLMLKVSLTRNATTMDAPGFKKHEATDDNGFTMGPEQPEEDLTAGYPSLPSVTSIWRSAEWHEREAFDMMGIKFTGHPDLRRILLPRDWQGFPHRKDYEWQEKYHGIKVEY